MNSRSCCPVCKVGQLFIYPHFFFQLLVGEGISVFPGSVISHILSQFSTFPCCSLLLFSAQREVVLYWVRKKRKENVTGIEAVLHVGTFSLLDSLVLKWQLPLLGCVTLGRLLNHAEL